MYRGGDRIPHVSVVTPTYNRALELLGVYESLCAQTFGDFEWIICDDGSTDNTEAVVNEWKRDAPFQITYFRQENHGKHIALNNCSRRLRGEMVCEVDSDDALMPDAVDWIVSTWKSIPESSRAGLCGLVAQKVNKDTGERIAPMLDREGVDIGFLDAYFKLRRREENHKIIKSSVYLEYPFPAVHSGTYFPECAGKWFPMSRSYAARWYNKVTYRHNFSNESIQRQSSSGAPRRQWHNMILAGKMHLETDLDYFWSNPRHFATVAAQYACYGFQRGDGFRRLLGGLDGAKQKLLFLAACPIGYAVYLRRYLTKSIPC